MDISEYSNIRTLEDTHWWYVSTHYSVRHQLKGLSCNSMILDAGCGTGGFLSLIRDQDQRAVIGFDASIQAIYTASEREELAGSLSLGLIEAIPFQANQFDTVTCVDVIYHSKVHSDKKALEEVCRVLKPGGCLILQVPALECLRGGHDEAVHTRKRYHLEEIRSLLSQSGFNVVKVFYRYPWLFFPALVIRHLTRGSGKSDLEPVNPKINALLLQFSAWFESLPFHSVFPFGTSLLAIGRKI